MTETKHQITVFDLMKIGSHPDKIAWEQFRTGIKIHRIYGNQSTGPSAALLWYEPGAELPTHRHMGYEHLLILHQSQTDETGEKPAGTLIVNPPGSEHTVLSPRGCIVLAIWEKPVNFDL